MDIGSVCCVCFSPTGSSKAIAAAIARGVTREEARVYDTTRRSHRSGLDLRFHRQDLVILAVPVYYGRVPEEALASFSTLSGDRTPVVTVVVYGNRAYDDALRELQDFTAARNFLPVAAGAFVAEHSYSSPAQPIAPGRPDADDLRRAAAFGAAVRDKLQETNFSRDTAAVAVPGRTPYVEPEKLKLIRQLRATTPLTFTPETDPSLCTSCGTCVESCPTGALAADDPATVAKDHCLICFACVKSCPVGAKAMRLPQFEAAISALAEACQVRKEPQVFL